MFRKYFINRWLLILLVLIYIILAIYKINYPGLQFDEVLFANAAWKRIDSVFITKVFWKIPIMVMPYIGALKSWLYFFIFRIFDVSVYSIRIPMVLLTALSLFALYESVNYFLNKKTALITIGLLILDSSFISLTRYDVGPNAIEFFLKSISLLSLVFFLKSGQKRLLFLTIIILFLGIFNKSNFIWWINSLLIMVVTYLVLVKKYSWKKIKWLLLIPIILILYLISNFKDSPFNLTKEIDFTGVLNRIPIVLFQLENLLNGKMFYIYIVGNFPKNNLADFYLIFWRIILVIGGLILLFKKNKSKKIYFIICLGILVGFFQLVVTVKATGPWHYFTLYPLITILMAASLDQIVNYSKKLIVSLTLLIFVTYYLINNYFIYAKGFAGYLKNPAWSTQIQKLTEFTKSKNNKFVVLDWGFVDLLILFDPVNNKYLDLWGTFNISNKVISHGDEIKIIKNYFKDNSLLYIIHGESSMIIPESRRLFKELADKNGYKLILIKQFSDIGRPDIYQIFKIIPKT